MDAARSRAARAADYSCSIWNPQLQTTPRRSRRLPVVRQWIFAAVCAGAVATTSPARADGAGYSQRLAALVNQYRAEHGRAALRIDDTLTRLALDHSAAMAKAGRMNHDGFETRARQSGFAMCIENVGWNYRSPDAQLDGWRASPGHDRNMLDAHVERIGVAELGGYVTLLACGH
jgi:uncharacterized protein YkwD